jgi:hypothetical protein
MNSTINFFKKGYLQIDFLFVVLCFLLLFAFTYTQYLDRSNQYSNYLNEKEKRVDLSFMCDLLVSTSGSPNDWDSGSLIDVDFYGLKEENSSFIDSQKYSVFFNNSNYLEIYDSYDSEDILYFVLKNTSGFILSTLGETPVDSSLAVSEFCFTQNRSSLLILEVGLWK